MNERSFIMPTLSTHELAARKRRIEDAALKLFLKQGFHGVGLREVAKTANVSLGNIYNHYEGKEPLFTSLLARLYGEFVADTGPLLAAVQAGHFPSDLVKLGRVIGALVERNRAYLTLVYVDIAEFGGVHVRPHYDGLAAKFAAGFGTPLTQARTARGTDPAVAFAAVYLLFSNYFILSGSIGARPFGLGEDASIEALAAILSKGVLR
jgi:AcrR family transcriptional regulator